MTTRKSTNNGLQNTTQNTRVWTTRTSLEKTRVKGKQFLLQIRHPSYNSRHKPSDKSWKKKRSDCDYEKRNIPLIICVTHILLTTVNNSNSWLQLTHYEPLCVESITLSLINIMWWSIWLVTYWVGTHIHSIHYFCKEKKPFD